MKTFEECLILQKEPGDRTQPTHSFFSQDSGTFLDLYECEGEVGLEEWDYLETLTAIADLIERGFTVIYSANRGDRLIQEAEAYCHGEGLPAAITTVAGAICPTGWGVRIGTYHDEREPSRSRLAYYLHEIARLLEEYPDLPLVSDGWGFHYEIEQEGSGHAI